MERYSDDDLGIFESDDCDTNEEVDSQSPTMPAGLSIPDAPFIPESPGRELRRQARDRRGMKEEEPWLSPNNPAIWDGDDEESEPPDFGSSVTILGDS